MNPAALYRRATRRLAIAVLCSTLPLAASADPRPPDVLDAARIRHALDRLQVAGSALFVAAHPDDENTALLAWLGSGRKVRTAYLSLTRGDGGQNLIGSEVGEALGVLRTQELLAARRVDGAEQFFTRAKDFGFSKRADETLDIWGRERILGDMVRVIRRFQPDVIITRFPPDSTGGHGHHQASAILAAEAFRAAADPARFAEPGGPGPWQATRLVWNVFRPGAAGVDTTPGRVRVDLGAYDPLLGRSYTEIAGESRSLHKSQGFGAAERRGTWINSFEHRDGVRAGADLFEGVPLTWERVPGGSALIPLLRQAAREFRAERPEAILPILGRALAVMEGLPAGPLVERRRAELIEVMRSCAGLWLEAIATAPTAIPGGRARILATAIHRSPAEIVLDRIELLAGGTTAPTGTAPRPLPFNRGVTDTLVWNVPADAEPTGPYWLAAPGDSGGFAAGRAAAGDPENEPLLSVRFHVRLGGRSVAIDRPVVYRWVDRVQGERYREVALAPPAGLRFDRAVYLFAGAAARDVGVQVQAGDRSVRGALRVLAPAGWSVTPAEQALDLAREADTTLRFRVVPGPAANGAGLRAEVTIDGVRHARQVVPLDYPHIPLQTLLPAAEARLVRTDLARSGVRVGYLAGSGDAIPEALREMGFTVVSLEDDEVESGDLARFDAIVSGVRAYNTRPRLRRLQHRLLDYVAAGGRLVIQYVTTEEGLQDRLGPYPFRISRDRVTVERAAMVPVRPDHRLLNAPNRIGPADFEGWVQERGLYFAGPWDSRYETLFESHDPGEKPLEGGLIVARHGRGTFIYTGLAFFRQLPAGVPGAWRLFANLVSADSGARP